MNSSLICESCGELAENRLALSCGHFICGPPDDENLKSSDRQRLETLERKRCPKHKDCQKNIKILRKIYVQGKIFVPLFSLICFFSQNFPGT